MRSWYSGNLKELTIISFYMLWPPSEADSICLIGSCWSISLVNHDTKISVTIDLLLSYMKNVPPLSTVSFTRSNIFLVPKDCNIYLVTNMLYHEKSPHCFQLYYIFSVASCWDKIYKVWLSYLDNVFHI